jgi:hypothetical protein
MGWEGDGVAEGVPAKIKRSYDDLDLKVVDSGGVLTTDMRDLRDRVLAGKLGRFVVESIKDQLKQRGLGHSELTLEQWADVRIWKQGTAVGKFIEAALTPGAAQDEKLRELADNNADEILKQIKTLVGA